jgi:hypothetical protein
MSLPNQDMLLSNDLSSPDINVPMSVTDKTPIIIPKAVSRERVLFAKTEDKDILKFSKNSKIIWILCSNLQLFLHLANGLLGGHAELCHLHELQV